MLEEHVGDHNKEFKDFGDADDILSRFIAGTSGNQKS